MRPSVLIDSHGWIEYFSGGPLAGKYAEHIEAANKQNSITPSIIIYEVYKRIKSLKGESSALEAIAHIVEHTTIVQIDDRTALNAAEISLKTKLAMADAMIKAVAEAWKSKIITGDPHFRGFPDVVFVC